MPRRQKLYHYIYKTTCQVTGKFYVGMHSTDDLGDGYLGSGKILGYSIAKHGDENHINEILEHLSSREALKLREKELVNEELLADPLNINLKYGGEGGWEGSRSQSRAGKARIAAVKRRLVEDEDFGVQWSKTSTKNNLIAYANGRRKVGWSRSAAAAAVSDEANEKRSLTLKLKYKQGLSNSQSGTCWIKNTDGSIKIKKEQLDEYLSKGYSRGRTIGS